MAIQEQNQNSASDFLQVLKRRAGLILLPAGLVITASIALAKLLPRKYSAQTGIELRESQLPTGGQGFNPRQLQQDVANTPWQVKQFERVKRVVEKLEWADYTDLSAPEKHEYIRKLLDTISVLPTASKNGQGSSLITIKAISDDPLRAEQLLNRLREAYVSEVLERYRSDARQQLTVLANQKQLAEAETKLKDEQASALKKKYGISATQQAPGGGRQRDEDPVYTRKNKVDADLLIVGSAIAADTAALATLKQQFKDTPAELSESEITGGISFDQDIADIDNAIEDLRETQVGYKPLSTTYIRAEDKILKLQEKKRQLTERVTSPSAATTMKPNPARALLQAQIQVKELVLRSSEAQKAQLEADQKTLAAQQAERVEIYKQIGELDREAQAAAENYLKTTGRFTDQKNFVDNVSEGWANPFEVTEQARAPIQPTSPNVVLVIGGGVVAGFALGLFLALTTEFGRNGFRGVGDAARSLSVPVLGAINGIRTRRERRASTVRSVLVTCSTLALMAAIMWITWAYENRHDALGVLGEALDGFREALR